MIISTGGSTSDASRERVRALVDTGALLALISPIDAVSFEVMRRNRLTHAFAFDRHFEIAGFELLG